MGTSERREREKAELRRRIVSAAADILSESGLEGLSMRKIARRIEYSPATIYLYFRDKDDLIRAVVREGMRLLSGYVRDAMQALPEDARPADRYRASGRGYVEFALENTAFFHVIFDLPVVARMECPEACDDDAAIVEEHSFERVIETLEQARHDGTFAFGDVQRAAVTGWALLHGLLSLYLSGHLRDVIDSREAFEELIAESMSTLGAGWSVAPESGAADAA